MGGCQGMGEGLGTQKQHRGIGGVMEMLCIKVSLLVVKTP